MSPFMIFMIVFNAALLLYYALVILSDYTNLKKKQADKAEVINAGDAESAEDSGPKQVTQDPESGNIDIKDNPREIKPEEASEISEPEEAEAATSESISHEADGQQAGQSLPAAPSVEKEDEDEAQASNQSDNQSAETQQQTPSDNDKAKQTDEEHEEDETKENTNTETSTPSTSSPTNSSTNSEKQEQPNINTQQEQFEEPEEPEPSPAVMQHAKDTMSSLNSIRRHGNTHGRMNLKEHMKNKELAIKKNIATKDEVYKL